MEKYFVGSIGLAIGAAMFLLGLKLKKKFQSVAEYKGIGSFGFSFQGVAWFGGCLLIIFGTAAILVSLMLLCL